MEYMTSSRDSVVDQGPSTTRIFLAPALPRTCTIAPIILGCDQNVSSINQLPNRCDRTPMKFTFMATVLPFTNPLRPPS